MKKIYLIGLMVFLTAAALSGCGGDGGAAGPDVASITLTPSRAVALAGGADVVTIQADVKKADGSAAADGTVVAFSVPGSAGALSSTTAVCSGGTASVTLNHPSIATDNVSVFVTAAAGSASGNTVMKFINQPLSVEVSIAVNKTVAGAALLQLKLNSTAGATFNNADPQQIFAINNASGSLVTGNFDAVTNSNTIAMVHATGFNPVAGTPIIRATYSVAAGTSLPIFSIDAITPIIAKDLQGPIVPELTAADFVVTTMFNTE